MGCQFSGVLSRCFSLLLKINYTVGVLAGVTSNPDPINFPSWVLIRRGRRSDQVQGSFHPAKIKITDRIRDSSRRSE
jgi:hypothetical protein